MVVDCCWVEVFYPLADRTGLFQEVGAGFFARCWRHFTRFDDLSLHFDTQHCQVVKHAVHSLNRTVQLISISFISLLVPEKLQIS